MPEPDSIINPGDKISHDLLPIVKSFELVEATSAKSGKRYRALELVFTDGYKKLIFLDRAEMFMVDALVTKSLNNQEDNLL